MKYKTVYDIIKKGYLHQKSREKNMEKRSQKRRNRTVLHIISKPVGFFKNYTQWSNRTFIIVLLLMVALSMLVTLLLETSIGTSLTSGNSAVLQQ